MSRILAPCAISSSAIDRFPNFAAECSGRPQDSRVSGIGVGTLFEEGGDEARVTVGGSDAERRPLRGIAGIDVGAAVDQQLQRLGPVAVGREMQRTRIGRISLRLQIGAGIDQHDGDADLIHRDGQMQRRPRETLGVHIGACGKQRLHAGDIAGVHRVEQVVLPCSERQEKLDGLRALPKPGILQRPDAMNVRHVHRHALPGEQRDHLAVPVERRVMQRSLAIVPGTRHDIGAVLQEQARQLDVAGQCRKVQRRVAVDVVAGHRIGAARQEQRRCPAAVEGCRHHQRRASVHVPVVDVLPLIEQPFEHPRLVAHGRPVHQVEIARDRGRAGCRAPRRARPAAEGTSVSAGVGDGTRQSMATESMRRGRMAAAPAPDLA